MASVPARGSAPWWGQVAAIVAALAAWFAIVFIDSVVYRAFHVTLAPVPVVTIIACLVTISVRSLWPVSALAALSIGFFGYAIAVNTGSHTYAATIATHLQFIWAIQLVGQLAVGAIAGWLWYRRESRLACPPASA